MTLRVDALMDPVEGRKPTPHNPCSSPAGLTPGVGSENIPTSRGSWPSTLNTSLRVSETLEPHLTSSRRNDIRDNLQARWRTFLETQAYVVSAGTLSGAAAVVLCEDLRENPIWKLSQFLMNPGVLPFFNVGVALGAGLLAWDSLRTSKQAGDLRTYLTSGIAASFAGFLGVCALEQFSYSGTLNSMSLVGVGAALVSTASNFLSVRQHMSTQAVRLDKAYSREDMDKFRRATLF